MTQEAKFTPGPWVVSLDGWKPWEGAIEIAAPSSTIAWTPSGGNEEADARLIAAAPDLLAMLKVAQLWLDVDDGRFDMQGINAAIAKAEA